MAKRGIALSLLATVIFAFCLLVWQHFELSRRVSAGDGHDSAIHKPSASLLQALRNNLHLPKLDFHDLSSFASSARGISDSKTARTNARKAIDNLRERSQKQHDNSALAFLDFQPKFESAVPEDLRGLGAAVWEVLQAREKAATATETAKLLVTLAAVRSLPLNLVQVGACDGNWEATNDPVQELLTDPRVNAIVLEPVPYLHKELDERLMALPEAKGRLLSVNAALCLEKGENVEFYVVSKKFVEDHPDAYHWSSRELGSFSKSHLTKHHIPNRYIETINVPCMAPPQLFEVQDSPVGTEPNSVDVVVVDAEGLDADLVTALLHIEKFRPAVVIFEQKHVKRARLRELVDFLRGLRYVHWRDEDQVVAVLAAPPVSERSDSLEAVIAPLDDVTEPPAASQEAVPEAPAASEEAVTKAPAASQEALAIADSPSAQEHSEDHE